MATNAREARSVEICSSCKKAESVKYCQDCDEHYCIVCVDFHKRFPALKNHVVLDRGYVNICGKQTIVSTETCDRHPGKLVELFCGQHKELCCNICVSLYHRICEGMIYIEEAAKDEDINFFNFHLKKLKAQAENKLNFIQQAPLKIETFQQNVLEHLSNLRKNVNEKFDSLENKIEDEMIVLGQEQLSRRQDHVQSSVEVIDKINLLQQQLGSTISSNKTQTFINMKKCQLQIPNIRKAVEKIPLQYPDAVLAYKPNQDIVNFLEKLKSLGTVSLTCPPTTSDDTINRFKADVQNTELLMQNLQTKSFNPLQPTHNIKKQLNSAPARQSTNTTPQRQPRNISPGGQLTYSTSQKQQTISVLQKQQTNSAPQKQQTSSVLQKQQTNSAPQKQQTSSVLQKQQTNPAPQRQTNSKPQGQITSFVPKGQQINSTSHGQEIRPLHVSLKSEKCNIKMQSDTKRCSIDGMCQMPDGSILLSDHDNCNIKLLNDSYTIISDLVTASEPFQMCTTSDHEIAVALDDSKLTFVDVYGRHLKIRNSIKFSHACYGVAHSNSILYISDDDDKIYMHAMDGKHLKTIKQDFRYRKIFFRTRKLFPSSDGSLLYVADAETGLVVLDREGELVSRSVDARVIGAESVYVADDERVLVCNLNTNKIIQMDRSGTRVVTEVEHAL